ncbi:MAG: sigma-70 family RNA polymerase sigma factor [Solirubrobacterales bacterium]
MRALTEDVADETTLTPPSRSGRAGSRADTEDLVLAVVSRHAEALLRLARRHSLCASDAEDAYQRGLEIFLRHAPRLDPERAPAWLRTVVKHEAMAVRRSRQRDVAPGQYDFDAVEASTSPSPDEQVAGFERVARSAEALGTLKPQEVRALWLRAQGNSYDEIQQETGWTRTQVNRCLYEGRRAFLARYAGIEAGEECRRWEPALSALADGEAGQAEMVALRAHLRGCSACRATVREIQRSAGPVAVVLPAGGLALAADQADAAGQAALRAWEAVTAWLFERAVLAVTRIQVLFEALVASAGKGTAVVAAGAAVASGGTVAIEQAGRGHAPAGAQRAQANQVAAATDAAGVARRAQWLEQRREAADRARARSESSQVPVAQPPAAVAPAPAAQPAAPAAPAAPPAREASGAEFGLE